MKLYTFSKTSWHVKFYKWLYGTNPVDTFNTMCPYFWTYVLTFIFLPLILIVKLFGSYGNKFLKYLESRKRVSTERSKQKFIDECSKEDLSNKDAYNICKSKCWNNFSYCIDFNIYNRVREGSDEYAKELLRVKWEKDRLKTKRKYDTIKDNKFFTIFSYIISVLILMVIGYLLFLLASAISWSSINWLIVGKVFLGILIIVTAIVLLYLTTAYILTPFIKWLSCRKLPECGLCKKIAVLGKVFTYLFKPFVYIFKGIIHFFAIIIDMIKSTYEKSCPLITWEDK